MSGGSTEMSVQLLEGSDTDAEELAQLADRLRIELLDMDVEQVGRSARGEAPLDSKGAGLLAVGELVVRLASSPEVLLSIIAGVRSWLGRQRIRGIKLTVDGDSLELTHVSPAEQERLIDLWVARHARSA